MSVLKDKSIENIETVDILINNGKYTPSVHCAYYSCLQLSKHILNHFCSIDYATQENEGNSKGSHNYIINTTAEKLQLKGARFSDYHLNIGKLKMLRIRSDYSTSIISQKEASKAKGCAESVLDILKQTYISDGN